MQKCNKCKKNEAVYYSKYYCRACLRSYQKKYEKENAEKIRKKASEYISFCMT